MLMAPRVVAAQARRRLRRVGCLVGSSEAASRPLIDAFRQRLRELSYVEGETMVLDYRWAEGHIDRLDGLAAELARVPVEVIYATGVAAVHAAKRARATIPIVMRITADPIAIGLAASFAKPGGNVTGVADFASPSGKHLEILKQVLPDTKRVAVLHNPTAAQTASQMRETREFARALGLELFAVEVRVAAEIDSAVAAIAHRTRAVAILSDALFGIHTKRIVELTVKNRLVATYSRREFADAGGMISYGSSLRDQYRMAATYVDKILRGAKPADLPIEQPTTFELVINTKTARAIGVTIPPSLLLRADQVIE